MTAGELTERETALTAALAAFDWNLVQRLGDELATAALHEPMPEAAARRLLHKLRRKRRFRVMAKFAGALIQGGARAPQIRRQHAQALIDQGLFAAAELALESLLRDPQINLAEQCEAHGLLGRVYKQLYVTANAAGGPYPTTRAFLERSVNAYLSAYNLERENNYWHGINVFALVMRARQDGFGVEEAPHAETLARDILASLERREVEAVNPVPAFEIATAMEAWVGLSILGAAGAADRAEQKALEYAGAGDADAFEIASTLRQLEEVWRLEEERPPGARILPVLRAALLRREGGGVTISPDEGRRDLEKVFGADRFQAVSWYQKGLARCHAIARIERLNGTAHGTGWLVNAAEFFPRDTGLLLVTNAHVVSSTPHPEALLPWEARATFHMLGTTLAIHDEVRWLSPVEKLDAAFLRLKGAVGGVEPLPMHDREVEMKQPPPRLYVIGHPSGGDLAFSLQDNYLLGCTNRLLHYRTPTEGGSSGSPVFEADDWRVVALHHAGGRQIERLDGAGTYEANEGIAIGAIRKAIQENPAAPDDG
jgi:hypothetical protein